MAGICEPLIVVLFVQLDIRDLISFLSRTASSPIFAHLKTVSNVYVTSQDRKMRKVANFV